MARLLPPVLSFYLARRFLVSFLTIMGGLLSIVYVAEMLELLRRSAAHPEVGFGLVLRMAALKLPGTAQVILPSAMLFAALYFFWQMTRTRELEVARAAGVSVWNILTPICLAAGLIGLVDVTLVNPLGAAMISRFERMEDRYFNGRPTTLNVSSSGLWVTQSAAEGAGQAQIFLHAQSLAQNAWPEHFTLQGVTVFENPTDPRRGRRIDAATVRLVPGAWELEEAFTFDTPSSATPTSRKIRLPTTLTRQRIEESFASPSSLSFWKLPDFIHTLQAAGLSSTRHQLYFQSLLSQPFLLAAMVVLAAVFGLRQTRRGGLFGTLVTGLVLGLLLFILNDVLQTFAESGGMPITLAAWGPAGVGLMGGAAALFHSEDG